MYKGAQLVAASRWTIAAMLSLLCVLLLSPTAGQHDQGHLELEAHLAAVNAEYFARFPRGGHEERARRFQAQTEAINEGKAELEARANEELWARLPRLEEASRRRLDDHRADRHAQLVAQLQERERLARARAKDNVQHTHRDRSLQINNPPPPPPAEWDVERAVLTTFYETMGGAAWLARANWLNGYPCDGRVWQGVLCSAPIVELAPVDSAEIFAPATPPPAAPPPQLPRLTPQIPAARVVGLLLRNISLVGTLPSELGLLSYLSDLRLPDNSISGFLPTQLGRLALAKLDLSSNRISGTMDGVLGLQPMPFAFGADASPAPPPPSPDAPPLSLTHLILSDNMLSGFVPSSLGARTQLRTFLASRNAQISGSLPAWLAPQLEQLQLSNTRLSGTLPTELGALSHLQHLRIERGSLAGTLPTQLGLCADLTTLSLEFNMISGSIPLELGGDCSRAFSYELQGTSRLTPGTDRVEDVSSNTDGPRGLHHPYLRPQLRSTAATLRFRGNLLTTNELAATVPVDIRDLTSHDVCAYARGAVSYAVSYAEGSDTVVLPGTIFRSPSPRATFNALVGYPGANPTQDEVRAYYIDHPNLFEARMS